MKHPANVTRCALVALVLAIVGSSASNAQTRCLSVGYGGGDLKFDPKVVPPAADNRKMPVPFAVNFGGWVRAAVPNNGSTVINPRVDYQAQNANGGTWHDCKLGGRCEGLDRNIGFITATPVVFRKDGSDQGWKEPEVVTAIIAHTYGPHLRIRMYYSWKVDHCQSLVWDRIEHNRTDTLAAMVPEDATVLEFGLRARDGNNGAEWKVCDKSPLKHCKDPGPGEIDFSSGLKPFVDADGHMKGYAVTVTNGNSRDVRNFELFIDYKMTGK